MSRKPLEVKLPVCDRCGSISVIAADSRRGLKFSCTGPTTEPHKRTTMTFRRFVEVLGNDDKDLQ